VAAMVEIQPPRFFTCVDDETMEAARAAALEDLDDHDATRMRSDTFASVASVDDGTRSEASFAGFVRPSGESASEMRPERTVSWTESFHSLEGVEQARRLEVMQAKAFDARQHHSNGCLRKSGSDESPEGRSSTGSRPKFFVDIGDETPLKGPLTSSDEVGRLQQENDVFREQNQALARKLELASSSTEQMRQENQRLANDLKLVQRAHTTTAAEALSAELGGQAVSAPAATPPDHSEGRLRLALTRQGTTTSELRQAIHAVESLVEEARRELKNSELRERRAAFEALHNAIDKGEEDPLEIAVEKAKLADVAVEDIAKGEAKLAELRALTPEQKAKKLANKIEQLKKKEAFVLIKRDDAEALEELIDSLAETVRWKEWRDYAGRNLWRCSLDLRGTRCQSFLAPLVGQRLPEAHPDNQKDKRKSTVSEGKRKSGLSLSSDALQDAIASGERRPSLLSGDGSPSHSPGNRDRDKLNSSFASRGSRHSSGSGDRKKSSDSPSLHPKSPSSSLGGAVEEVLGSLGDGLSPLPSAAEPSTGSTSAGPRVTNLLDNDGSPDRPMDEAPSDGGLPVSPARSEAESMQLRTQAMRAVAQDDCDALLEVLDQVEKDTWTTWENKAGKDLLTLATERGSTNSYSLLARELGILQEVFRHAFEERESVWVFEAGEVQPRRATIMEDTPAEEDEILIEFWDGDDPPLHVDRCIIHKMAGN